MGFCIYIGRKWFGLCVGIWCVRLVKVLIFFGFDDIGYDIEKVSINLQKVLIFFVILKFSVGV